MARREDGWLARLVRRAGLDRAPEEVTEGLAGLREAVTGELAGLREAVERLEKASIRAGKEQFKANALAETQQQLLKEVLAQLSEAEGLRQREVAQLRQELARAGEEARLELIKRLLAVLDGLDQALASGTRLQARGREGPVPRPGFRRRLGKAIRSLFAPSPAPAEPAADPLVGAWLEGLGLVRERFLEVLAAEGVRPIETAGGSFDPHWHVAAEIVAAEGETEPEAVVGEVRRGYAVGDRVLRYAEVVVARGGGRTQPDRSRPGRWEHGSMGDGGNPPDRSRPGRWENGSMGDGGKSERE